MTITFISQRSPGKVLRHLETEQKYTIQKVEKGIYYIQGNLIPIQFIVTSKLTSKENLWLRGLTNRLKDFELTASLTEEYQKHKKNTLYQSVMDVIMRANKHQFEEARNMCEAMREWIREEYADEIQEERENGLKEGERRVNALILKLLELGRNEDIRRSAIDSEYQQQLFEEFGL